MYKIYTDSKKATLIILSYCDFPILFYFLVFLFGEVWRGLFLFLFDAFLKLYFTFCNLFINFAAIFIVFNFKHQHKQ